MRFDTLPALALLVISQVSKFPQWVTSLQGLGCRCMTSNLCHFLSSSGENLLKSRSCYRVTIAMHWSQILVKAELSFESVPVFGELSWLQIYIFKKWRCQQSGIYSFCSHWERVMKVSSEHWTKNLVGLRYILNAITQHQTELVLPKGGQICLSKSSYWGSRNGNQ